MGSRGRNGLTCGPRGPIASVYTSTVETRRRMGQAEGKDTVCGRRSRSLQDR